MATMAHRILKLETRLRPMSEQWLRAMSDEQLATRLANVMAEIRALVRGTDAYHSSMTEDEVLQLAQRQAECSK